MLDREIPKPVLVCGNGITVPFDTSTPVVSVVPITVVGVAVATVVPVKVTWKGVVMVVADMVVGETVSVSTEEVNALVFTLPGIDGALSRAVGYGTEIDDCSEIAEGFPPRLVGIALETGPELVGSPDVADGTPVNVGWLGPPLVS